MGIHMDELSDEARLVLALARKEAKVDKDILLSEIDDIRRDLNRCVDALREIYAAYGEDKRIAAICGPLISEFSR